MFLNQAYTLQPNGAPPDEAARLALRLITELAPRNVTEGMLAVQMIGVNTAVVEFLRRSQFHSAGFDTVLIQLAGLRTGVGTRVCPFN
jgi:hypothetical protein